MKHYIYMLLTMIYTCRLSYNQRNYTTTTCTMYSNDRVAVYLLNCNLYAYIRLIKCLNNYQHGKRAIESIPERDQTTFVIFLNCHPFLDSTVSLDILLQMDAQHMSPTNRRADPYIAVHIHISVTYHSSMSAIRQISNHPAQLQRLALILKIRMHQIQTSYFSDIEH